MKNLLLPRKIILKNTKGNTNTMKDYKFDTFYYSVDNSNEHYLSEIENLPDEEYEQLYKGKMNCPRCKGPQLTLVRMAESSFLRTYPNQYHQMINGQICPYSFKPASKSTMENYVQELRDKKKIKSALEAIMRRLFELHTHKAPTLKTSNGTSKNALLIEKKQNKTIKRRVIPHYSFKSWGKNIPQDQLLIVYGKVYIELKDGEYKDSEGNTCTKTYLHFKDIRTREFITSCSKPQKLIISSGNYYAAVLGHCYTKEVKGHTYYNLWINSPIEQSILLKQV